MSYLVIGHTIRILNNDHIALVDELPIGIYKYFFDPKEGSWLEPYKYNTSHSKIYGDSNQIANHIIKRYELNSSKDNFGVLLSGGKGLGKSLTVRLVVEKLKATCPVIIVDTFTPDLGNFLSNIKNAVIIMDEFDKFMKGPSDNGGPEDNTPDEMTKQEALLSVFDGVGNKLNNLYLLTCNDVSKIDTNFISRPGRIKYHYAFTSLSESAIKAYCKDNLDDKSQLDDVVRVLKKFMYISFDIVRAVVEELNLFDVSVEDALTYLNVAKPKKDLLLTVNFDKKTTEDGTSKWDTDQSACYHFYDVDLNSTIEFNVNPNSYFIDLDGVDFTRKTILIPLNKIMDHPDNSKTKNVKLNSVKISLIGAENILGKSVCHYDW